MDLTGVFSGRAFNLAINNKPPEKSPSTTPFNPPFIIKRNEKEEKEYENLANYYRNLEGSEDCDDDSIDFNDTHPFLNFNVNYDERTIDEDVLILRSYHRYEKYIDSNNNIYEVVDRDDNYIEVIINGHLPKLNRNKVVRLTRDAFLNKMGYRFGGDTDLYQMKERYKNFET